MSIRTVRTSQYVGHNGVQCVGTVYAVYSSVVQCAVVHSELLQCTVQLRIPNQNTLT